MVHQGKDRIDPGGACVMSDFYAYLNPVSGSTEYNKLQFAMRRFMAQVRTASPAQVLAVSNAGDVSPVGTVDLQPLVYQTDAAGSITAMPVIYGVPYIRIQGGANAIIIDPQVGDIGMAIFADRDISAVVASKAAAAPGSNRRNSLSDALFVNGTLNGTPTQYVQFNTAGIKVVSPTLIDLQAPNIKLDGIVEITGATTADSTVHIKGAQTNDSTIVAQGNVTGQSTSLHTHVHTGVTSGSTNSGQPA
jgi:hypothetical protein